MAFRHELFEKNSLLLLVGILVTVSIGGIVQMVPLATMDSTIEKVEGVRPYSPLELAGRNIYVREGCYNCHSQQVRPFRDEVDRYGHYSLAAESRYDHPFQWGSKRTGPDLARVGGKYSNEWQVEHLVYPQGIVPGSVMPPYPFLAGRALNFDDAADHLRTLRIVGVPYDDAMVEVRPGRSQESGRSRRRQCRFADPLPESGGGEFRRRCRGTDGDGCAGSLSPGTRHAGGFFHLRQVQGAAVRKTS